MYRLQIYDEKTTGMHWHIHKDGSVSHDAHRRAGKPMEVAVAIGTDPTVTYAATAPLPSSLLLRAGGATLAAVGSLAVYATRTKRDFTAKHGMLVSGIAALWLMGLLQFFFGGSLLASAPPSPEPEAIVCLI